MQTIIMTVGTSLRTNPDKNLAELQKRPWHNRSVPIDQKIFDSLEEPLGWMKSAEYETISAEINTLWRLDPKQDDCLILLYSDTTAGLECAEVIEKYLQQEWEQNHIQLIKLPDIDYELEGSALEKMAKLLKELIDKATGVVTLAATGGFKAQTMVMGLVGNALGVPVCYVHETYKTLVYLPYINLSGQPQPRIQRAALPESSRPRDQVISLQGEQAGHHRPKSWRKVERLLKTLPWVELVYFDSQAFSAPKNGVKTAMRTNNNQQILWLHLHDSEQAHLAASIVTTASNSEQLQEAATELRERLGGIL